MGQLTDRTAELTDQAVQPVAMQGWYMPHRLLVVEAQPLAHRVYPDPIPQNFIWERIEWLPALRDRIRERNPDLLVLVAVSATAQAASLMVLLQNKPLPTPALIILPNDASDELIGLASQVLDDFIFAPVRSSEFQHRIDRIIGCGKATARDVDEHLIRELALAGLIGRNPAFLRAISKIPPAARSNGPVLITGETGTGKELCARAIHALGPRRNYGFVAVDCATVPEHLFESELFGHARGAFTDARSDHKGLVSLANGGTLFLDEIDSLSLTAQSKMLRLLQERSYRPVGCERSLSVDANIVAASNSDLRHMVQIGKFRADLFFRLNVLRLNLVPLRQRRDDIGLLARQFVKQACAENGIAIKALTPATLSKLTQHDWPGNVRELYNAIQRAVVFSGDSMIQPSDILETEDDNQDGEPTNDNFRQARSRAIESFERGYVEHLMRETGGNVTRAARLAHKERRAFGRLVKRYGVKRPDLY
jgi:two-component system response regulator GlrR